MIYIFLILIILFIIFFPYIRSWALGRLQRKMEDNFRRMMGMPTSAEAKKEEKKKKRKESRKSGGSGYSTRNSRRKEEKIIPPEYAEDVEFTEIHEYSETTVIADDGNSRVEYHESQISDAEYEEIRQ